MEGGPRGFPHSCIQEPRDSGLRDLERQYVSARCFQLRWHNDTIRTFPEPAEVARTFPKPAPIGVQGGAHLLWTTLQAQPAMHLHIWSNVHVLTRFARRHTSAPKTRHFPATCAQYFTVSHCSFGFFPGGVHLQELRVRLGERQWSSPKELLLRYEMELHAVVLPHGARSWHRGRSHGTSVRGLRLLISSREKLRMESANHRPHLRVQWLQRRSLVSARPPQPSLFTSFSQDPWNACKPHTERPQERAARATGLRHFLGSPLSKNKFRALKKHLEALEFGSKRVTPAVRWAPKSCVGVGLEMILAQYFALG